MTNSKRAYLNKSLDREYMFTSYYFTMFILSFGLTKRYESLCTTNHCRNKRDPLSHESRSYRGFVYLDRYRHTLST